jgi:drug/metabolite transporter (DMT)-like permease
MNRMTLIASDTAPAATAKTSATRAPEQLAAGVLLALGAGMMWGIVFIAPMLLGDYPGVVLSFGRYIAFGVIALVPAWVQRRRVAALTRADWLRALQLSAVGNLLYYAMLASAIQLAGAPLPTMLIGTLPVTIALYSNWLARKGPDAVAWRKLAPSLAVIVAGLVLLNAGELAQLGQVERSAADYALGGLLALGALLAWTWYPVMNARHLHEHPHIDAASWVTAQGLATLPLALACYGVYGLVTPAFAFPLGPRPALFVGLMLAVGLLASWAANVLWNMASRRVPPSLAGQLIVFETLFALLYAFIVRGALPAPLVAGGIALLCAGVWLGVRVFRRR